MLSAKLDRKIRIDRKVKTMNAVGTPTYAYSFFKNKFATVDYRGGRTNTGEYSERVQTDATFTIRYDSEVNYKCRIVFGGSVYKIDHIEIIGRNEGQRIRCVMHEIDD